MSRTARLATLVVAVVVALVALGCGGDGEGGGDKHDDGAALTRQQATEILLGQGYNPDSAACVIDEAARQDVNVLDVLTRDQVTRRELSVLASVQEYCVKQFGGSTVPTPPAGTSSDTAVSR